MQYNLNKEHIRVLEKICDQVKKIMDFDRGQTLKAREQEGLIARIHTTLNLNREGPSQILTRNILEDLPGWRPERLVDMVMVFRDLYSNIKTLNPFEYGSLINTYQKINLQCEQNDPDFTENPYEEDPNEEDPNEEDPNEEDPNEEDPHGENPQRDSIHLVVRSRIELCRFDPEVAQEKTKKLFNYLQNSPDHMLVKAIIAHLSIAAFQPIESYNDELGRLWQSSLMEKYNPVLGFLPWERYLREFRRQYYQALEKFEIDQKAGPFLEYILQIIHHSLKEVPLSTGHIRRVDERITYFLSSEPGRFTRKDYMKIFPSLSSSTASRDLCSAVKLGILKRSGNKSNCVYSPC